VAVWIKTFKPRDMQIKAPKAGRLGLSGNISVGRIETVAEGGALVVMMVFKFYFY
jgi:hypothetical protein